MTDFGWLKRCAKAARKERVSRLFADSYRQFRKEGATVISAATRAMFVANSLHNLKGGRT